MYRNLQSERRFLGDMADVAAEIRIFSKQQCIEFSAKILTRTPHAHVISSGVPVPLLHTARTLLVYQYVRALGLHAAAVRRIAFPACALLHCSSRDILLSQHERFVYLERNAYLWKIFGLYPC